MLNTSYKKDMKKIIALNGSPHQHGCTAALMNEVINSLVKQGADVKTYHISKMDIKYCQGCGGCTKHGKCVLQDDMQVLYDEIASADILILATPVYFWQMTAQLKTVIDRCQPFGRPNSTIKLEHGKKALIIATQGRPDETAFIPYFEHAAKSLSLLGFDFVELLIAGGTHEPEDVLNQNKVLHRAKKLSVWVTE
ncbi:iron-sulfur flavoprotein [Oxobacter pfennigii]|uniref:Iron-sulfur flavoprotein n=1 Tax=Oxobacter pfennigii TaxID=36849 RepID=A0A0P8WDV8_9CLOT|nr:flavodoxin family protein [Oxobacter pfennigii]KPU46238.1 iron-sulfur flavoprotein [Oxobacter pfennigii]